MGRFSARFSCGAAVRVPQVSSLWTPRGEHPVDPPRGGGEQRGERSAGPSGVGGADPFAEELDDDERRAQAEAIEAEMDAVRAQLAHVPAAQVIANHAMGLYELGAIHLSQQPPNLADAVLAIDAMATLVEGLGERLGETQPTLAAALAQIRLAFVQIKAAGGSSPA